MGESEILTTSSPFKLMEQREIFVSLSINIAELWPGFLSFKVKIAEITRAALGRPRIEKSTRTKKFLEFYSGEGLFYANNPKFLGPLGPQGGIKSNSFIT